MKNILLPLAICLGIAITSCKKDSAEAISTKSKPSNLITLKSGIVVEKRGNDYIWEGDILLSPTQLKALDEKGTIFTDTIKQMGPNLSVHPVFNLPVQEGTENRAVPRALGIYPTAYNMWAMVRFTINDNVPYWMRYAISDALHEIESQTNVRFYNATGQPTVDPTYGFAYPYVDFYYIGAKTTSESSVGRIGGRQVINLADFAASQPGAIIHEVCHALGMLHEQQRPDRDNYVNINTSNLTEKGLSNFKKITTNYYYLGSYDFNSVMGYSSSTTSAEIVFDTNQPMYTKKDGSYISQGWQLSDLDRRWLNSLNLPYIARSDVYRELADVVYKSDNTVMTEQERLDLQAQLNNGNPYPPAGGRIPNDF